VNGQTDVHTTIDGVVTYDPTGCRNNGGPGCTGTCHRESHDNECWY
jgi:hypothetical protein